jgi:hypothetical protein
LSEQESRGFSCVGAVANIDHLRHSLFQGEASGFVELGLRQRARIYNPVRPPAPRFRGPGIDRRACFANGFHYPCRALFCAFQSARELGVTEECSAPSVRRARLGLKAALGRPGG